MTTDKTISMEQLISEAIKAGSDYGTLIAYKERQDASDARRAYLDAVSQFKKNPPTVAKDKVNQQFNSKYSSIEAWLSAVNPELIKHGLSVHWDQNQSDGAISVTCFLTHELGHSESSTMKGPADASGAKNALQQIRSTVTYLRIGTLESILGMTSGLFSQNDDANGAAENPPTEIPAPNKEESTVLEEIVKGVVCAKITAKQAGDFLWASKHAYPARKDIAAVTAYFNQKKPQIQGVTWNA